VVDPEETGDLALHRRSEQRQGGERPAEPDREAEESSVVSVSLPARACVAL